MSISRISRESTELLKDSNDWIYNIEWIAYHYAKQYWLVGTSYLNDFYQDVYELYLKLKRRADIIWIIWINSFRPYFFASVKTLAIKKIKQLNANWIIWGDFNVSFSDEGTLDFISWDLNEEIDDPFLYYEKLNFKIFVSLLDFLPRNSRSVIVARYIHKFNAWTFWSLKYESLHNFKKTVAELKLHEENWIKILKSFLRWDDTLADYTYIFRSIDDSEIQKAIDKCFDEKYIKLVKRIIKYMKPRKTTRKNNTTWAYHEGYNSISMTIICKNLKKEITTLTWITYDDISDLKSYIQSIYSNICRKVCEYLIITPQSIIDKNS